MNLNTLQTGNLLIEAAEEKLLISVAGRTGSSTEISFEDLPVILDFLHTQRKLQMNRRKGFRLNISELKPDDSSLLELFVTTDHGRFRLQPVDFSLGGVLAEAKVNVGREGEFVVITVAYLGSKISLPAEIVRIMDGDSQIAFHFKNVIAPDGTLDPPEELATIFAALEACWLDTSLDLQWN